MGGYGHIFRSLFHLWHPHLLQMVMALPAAVPVHVDPRSPVTCHATHSWGLTNRWGYSRQTG
jgi:hypothetical protein